MPRLQEKGISRKRHAERNGCQKRDMPREKETPRKRHAKGKRGDKKKMLRLQEKEIFKEKACREKRMSGKRHAERIRGLKNTTCPRERETSRKRCQDFKRKRFQGKGMPRDTDVRKE